MTNVITTPAAGSFLGTSPPRELCLSQGHPLQLCKTVDHLQECHLTTAVPSFAWYPPKTIRYYRKTNMHTLVETLRFGKHLQIEIENRILLIVYYSINYHNKSLFLHITTLPHNSFSFVRFLIFIIYEITHACPSLLLLPLSR